MYIYVSVGLMRRVEEPTPAQWVNHLRLTWERREVTVWDKPGKGPEKTKRQTLTGRKAQKNGAK